MNTNEQEINLLNIQQIVSVLFIVSILISIYTTNQVKNDLKFNTKTNNRKLSEFNRYLSLSLLIIFFIINYNFLEIAKINNKDLRPFKYQLLAATFAIIASLIILYSFYLSNSIATVENPTS